MGDNGMMPSLIGNGLTQFANLDTSGKETERATRSPDELASVGAEFESVFLSLMLKEMRNTLESGGFFGEESSDTYGGLFDMFMGQSLAESSPLGVGDMLVKSYASNQAVRDAVDGLVSGDSENEHRDLRLNVGA